MQTLEASGFRRTLRGSLLLGTSGFTFASIVVYSLWAFGGRWFYSNLGEGGFYAVCALLFMALAGGLLYPLAIRSISFVRFHLLFAGAFMAYAIAWCAAWFIVRGRAGEWLGSLAGTLLMCIVFRKGFAAQHSFRSAALILFATHSAGYFIGSLLHDYFRSPAALELLGGLASKSAVAKVGMLMWGAAYGLGFGFGLSYVIHIFQKPLKDPSLGRPGSSAVLS